MSRIVSVALCGLVVLSSSAWAAKVNISAPSPGNNDAFGTEVKVLPNGNFVVSDPNFDLPGLVDVGRVYLYNRTGTTVLATLTGSHINDQVGSGGITVLVNGHYVVSSPLCRIGTALDAGAVTWRSGAASGGEDTVVAADNSLVGDSGNDKVGERGVTALTNGNYVVSSPFWDSEGVLNVGAATWGNGATGIIGAVSAANSLVGSSAGDGVGDAVTALTNGNYVVRSPFWYNGATANVGAVTWGNGNGSTVGEVLAGNSLIGSTANDRVGYDGVTALSNGHYVVSSSLWDNGAATNAGAVTWGNGATGITGVVSALNSLVGSAAGDGVGNGGVTALTNGNYVVSSPFWGGGGGVDYAGAATWGNGATGITDEVSATNSLIGEEADRVSYAGVTALANGHYVVNSPLWNDGGGVPFPGAATWGNGATGTTTGLVSVTNSLYGTQEDNQVSSGGSIALSDGTYVVISPLSNGADGMDVDVGMVTFRLGTSASPQNVNSGLSLALSLIGSSNSDEVGSGGVTALTNSNYVVISPKWSNGAGVEVGAITWLDQSSIETDGTPVTTTNSLYGSLLDDIDEARVTALPNGDYVMYAPQWDNAATVDAGVVIWGDGSNGTTGAIDPGTDSTVAGAANGGGPAMVFAYDAGDGATCDQLVIGRPAENIVTLLGNPACLLFQNGFE